VKYKVRCKSKCVESGDRFMQLEEMFQEKPSQGLMVITMVIFPSMYGPMWKFIYEFQSLLLSY
jgi:hypothetical protein